MSELAFPFLSLGLAVPLLTAVLLARGPSVEASRLWGSLTALFAAGMFAMAGRTAAVGGSALEDAWASGWLEVDTLDTLPLIAFSLLTLVTLLAMPKRDLQGRSGTGLLVMLTGTCLAYAAGTLSGMMLGWWLTLLPRLGGAFGHQRDRIALTVQVFGCAALTGAVWLTGFGHDNFAHSETAAFALLLAAVVLRKGVFPFHSWVLDAYDRGPLLPNALLFNGHLGAMMLLRAESTPLAGAAKEMLEWVSLAALATAMFASVAAIAQKRPRRVLALLSVSQAAFILAGLGSRHTEGIAGSLMHWLVVAVATTGLACVLRAVEARHADARRGDAHLGLAVRAPRLAVFFLVCGLALVGLPGTLGYCAEDLLFHGALERHPLLGISLLIATALNAIHLMRLYSKMFLGRKLDEVPPVPDALGRERWALATCVVFLVGTGLAPGPLISWRAAAAERLAAAFGKDGP